MCVVCVCLLHAERYFVVLNWHFSYIFHPLFASPTSPAWPEMKEKKEISYPVFLSRYALLPLLVILGRGLIWAFQQTREETFRFVSTDDGEEGESGGRDELKTPKT